MHQVPPELERGAPRDRCGVRAVRKSVFVNDPSVAVPDYVIDVSRPLPTSGVVKRLGLLLQAAGVALAAGIGILVLGTPIALAARAFIEVVRWLIPAS